jgi:phosphinothricin tripeptide acetyl hydrolase
MATIRSENDLLLGRMIVASPKFYRLVERMRSRATGGQKTIEELRAEMEETGRKFTPPDGVTFVPADASGVAGEWAIPSGAGVDAVILYLHGGGYGTGSIASHRHLAARIAQAASVRTFSIDYRLAPEHPFPAAVDDAVAAARWLAGQGVDPRRIVFAGDSAGGGLSIATCLALRDAGDPLPAAVVCMSPLTDLAKEGLSMRTKIDLDPMVNPASSEAYARRYVGEHGDRKAPLASPLYADLRSLPPMQILVGTWEVLLDDSTRFAERARAAGVEIDLQVWEEMIHIWPYFADIIPEGRDAIVRMAEFIRGKML